MSPEDHQRFTRAVPELRAKSITVIQTETAATWHDRAGAAYLLYIAYGQLQWLLDAEEYRHEAIEHAALVSPALVASVIESLAGARENARQFSVTKGHS